MAVLRSRGRHVHGNTLKIDPGYAFIPNGTPSNVTRVVFRWAIDAGLIPDRVPDRVQAR